MGFSLLEALQKLAAPAEIHRAAIVRVHQAEVPKLGALVKVRHSGGGDFEENLGQGVQRATPGQPGLEPLKVRQKVIAG